MSLTLNISLDNEQIEKAIIAYISASGIDTKNKNIEVVMIAGRKGSGIKADVSIKPEQLTLDLVVPVEETVEPIEEIEETEESTTNQIFG